MELNELVNLIGNVGFPVAVSAYLLIRLEKQITTLTSSINKLNTIISTKLGVVIQKILHIKSEVKLKKYRIFF